MRPFLPIICLTLCLVAGCKSTGPVVPEPTPARDKNEGIAADNASMGGIFRRIQELAK